MEVRANNVLVGAVTLMVLLLAFGIIYWVSRGEATGSKKNYRVLFTGSITGLAKGSTVLFNGIQVGQVIKVQLVPEDPNRAVAVIEVDAITPIKGDTRSRLEYIGLTGIAAVQLTGGTASAPALEAASKEDLPTLYADRSDFQDLVEAGRLLATRADSILSKIERVLGDNEAGIKSTMGNLEKFSKALGDNAGSVDALLRDAGQLGGKLNVLADRLNALIGEAGALGKAAGDGGVVEEITAAAKSVRLLAERLDKRTAEISLNLQKFSGNGLKEYEALASEGRRTLNDLNALVRSLERDPQQLLLGPGRGSVPEYDGRR